MTTSTATPSTLSTTCGVYFAPSSIPGGGWGTFAGANFAKHAAVIPGDLIVPLQDLSWHNGFAHGSEEPENLWLDYYWNAEK